MSYSTVLKDCLHELYVRGFDLAIPFSGLLFVEYVTHSSIVQCTRSETISLAMLQPREHACSPNRFFSVPLAHMKEIQGICGTPLSSTLWTLIISVTATQIPSIRLEFLFVFIHSYTQNCITNAFECIHVDKDIHFTFEMTRGRILPFQRISEVIHCVMSNSQISGLCLNSPLSHLSYHPVYGSWIGLRAVVVLDMEVSEASFIPVEKATNCICEGLYDEVCVTHRV